MWRDHVCPFHVECDLERPACISRWLCATRVDLLETSICGRAWGEPERAVEMGQVGADVWMIESIHDPDRLSRTLVRDGAEAVGFSDPRRRDSRWRSGCIVR